MVKVKMFFLVSLGILALALTFHLGALSARGQAGPSLTAFVGQGSTSLGGVQWAGDNSGGLWKTDNSTDPWVFVHQFPAEIVAIETTGFYVVLSSGDVYWYRPSSGTWEVINNVFANGPVQSKATTWGRVKAERR